MLLNHIAQQDMKYILKNLSLNEKNRLRGSNILITGCAGFLGYYFMNFFTSKMNELQINSIIGLDNFKLGNVDWINMLSTQYSNLKIYNFDIVNDNIENIEKSENCDIIIHMASIASPIFYRKYPIETLDANIWGLRRLLDFYKDKSIKGFLFFSSSEIYGDPLPEFIPTSEEYKGNVSQLGPRACYDESKRFGETVCYLFSEKYNMPVTIVRPFNNYGPGMCLDDGRVPADFARSVFKNKDIVMFSDGSPKRTFCYIADAIVGYLKVLLYGRFNYFNIGIDRPEVSIRKLSEIYVLKAKKVFNYNIDVKFKISKDREYLTNNPSRRCPNIDKARRILSYNPSIYVEDGIERFLEFIKLNNGIL